MMVSQLFMSPSTLDMLEIFTAMLTPPGKLGLLKSRLLSISSVQAPVLDCVE
jgi:hypothetical protein